MPLCLLFAPFERGPDQADGLSESSTGQETCFTIRWSCDMVLPGVAWDVF
jgi:hypothetical protein